MSKLSNRELVENIRAELERPDKAVTEGHHALMYLGRRLENAEERADELERRANEAEVKVAQLLAEVPRVYLRVLGSRDEGWRVAVVDVGDNSGHFVSAAYDSRDAALVSAFHWAMSNGLMVVTGERTDTP